MLLDLACIGLSAAANMTCAIVQGLKPLLPMLVALYRVLQMTSADASKDPELKPCFVGLAGGACADAIAAFAAQQLEQLCTLYGMDSGDLLELAMVNVAACIMPANANLRASATTVFNSLNRKVCCQVACQEGTISFATTCACVSDICDASTTFNKPCGQCIPG